MGIKHFFIWFKNQFPEYMHKIGKNQTLDNVDVYIDNLMIDMNGIFHNSAQKVYEYGNCKPPPRLMQPPPQSKQVSQLLLFQDVCKTIDLLVRVIKPTKRIILCVDGPAPISKQNQQRQRRFRSAMESTSLETFDSNSITPGTKMMDNLSKYIDWYLRTKISTDPEWQKLEVVFSNEKAPGEGEHKIINYIRRYGSKEETYCINGLDADLIMLALGTHLPNFYILREDLYDQNNEYFCIDIGKVHIKLAEIMRWTNPANNHVFIPQSAIDDFIFMCFIVGNDFLPHIPSIEIIEHGIDLILDIYRQVGASYGHITHNVSGKLQFVAKSLSIFMATIGQREKDNFELKMRKKHSFFPDPVIDKCSRQNAKGKWIIDIDLYKTMYWKASFPDECSQKQICHEYLEGMQWVLSYYTMGVPNWKWHFKHHYAPPASILALHFDTFKFPKYGITVPSTPYQQLLCVLPPKSAKLIPVPLCSLLADKNSPLKDHCPEKFKIDLAGKRKEWEGIVILPMVDFELVRKCYFDLISKVSKLDLKCNISGRTFMYEFNPQFSYVFKSYYGDIKECTVKTTFVDL